MNTGDMGGGGGLCKINTVLGGGGGETNKYGKSDKLIMGLWDENKDSRGLWDANNSGNSKPMRMQTWLQ